MTDKIKVDDEVWTTIIKPKIAFMDIDIKNIWWYKDLIFLLIRRDFVAFYKQTILGPLWFFIQPLITTIVFTIIFGNIAKIPTDGLPQPLFYMSGIVMWNYFATCLNNTSNTFIANSGLFGKVYFPRLVVPISVVFSCLIRFGIQFLMFLLIGSYFLISGADIQPNFYIFLTPLFLLQMGILGLGVGILISSLTTKYRDLSFLVGFGVQLWMYASPIVYPMSQIPEKWRIYFVINPMVQVIEGFRFAFLGVGSFNLFQYGLGWLITLLILFIGVLLFSRVEKTFMDTV